MHFLPVGIYSTKFTHEWIRVETVNLNDLFNVSTWIVNHISILFYKIEIRQSPYHQGCALRLREQLAVHSILVEELC